MLKTLRVIVGVVVVVACVTAFYHARQAAQWRGQVQSLQQQQALQAERIQELQRERDDAVRTLATLQEDSTRTNRNRSELLRLRGEVGVLRNENQQLRQALSSAVHTMPGPKDEVIIRQKFSVSYDPTLWRIKNADSQSMTWNLHSAASGWVQVTVASRPDRKDADGYKQERLSIQTVRGDPAKLVGEGSQTLADRQWTVLEFHNANTRPPRSEIHYFLPTNDGYLTAFVIGEAARMPAHSETIQTFLNQIRAK